MTEREKDILKAARKGPISSADAAFRLGIRLDEACRLLRTMTERGMLLRKGARRSYRYTVAGLQMSLTPRSGRSRE